MDIKKLRERAFGYTIPNKTFSKVFGIGANKTGTTSLETVFKAIGLNVPGLIEQELRIVKQLHAGNLEPLKEFVSRFDAFQDDPFSKEQCYAQVDALFPNSKFILTVREPEEWFESMCRFHVKVFGVDSVADFTEEFFTDKDKPLYIYPDYARQKRERNVMTVEDYKVKFDWSLLYDKEHRIKSYIERNDQIVRYFHHRPEDLLVIDITQEDDISKILEFLKLPMELNFEMPHKMRSK